MNNRLHTKNWPLNVSIFEKTSVTALFMTDAFIMTGRYSISGSGCWLSVISASAASIILIVSSLKLFNFLSNIYFKRIVKASAPFLTIIISSVSAIASILIFNDFIRSSVSSRISFYLVPLGIIITAVYSSLRKFTTFSRSVHFFVPLIIIFILVAATLTIPDAISEGLPFRIASDIYTQVIETSVITVIFYIKGLMLIYLFSAEKCTGKDCLCVSCGILICAVVISASLFITLCILDTGLYELLEYPLYYPLGLTPAGNYFERAEIISIIIFMITLTFKTGIFFRLIIISADALKQCLNESLHE